MPCSKEVTFTGAEPGRVFWGYEAPPPYGFIDLLAMPFWADSDFTDLLASPSTQTELAQWRSGTGYYFDFKSPTASYPTLYFWIGVPDDYAHPVATSGLQYGYGNTGTPTKDVLPFIGAGGQELYQNEGGLSNWVSGLSGVSTNGWYYTPYTITDIPYSINAVPYRFYVFGCHTNQGYDVCNPTGGGLPVALQSVGVQRTSNVATFTGAGGVDWTPFFGYAIIVSDMTDTSFNIPQGGVTTWSLKLAFSEWDYPNPGPDTAFLPDTGFTVRVYQRGNFPWLTEIVISDDHPIIETSATLFVTT